METTINFSSMPTVTIERESMLFPETEFKFRKLKIKAEERNECLSFVNKNISKLNSLNKAIKPIITFNSKFDKFKVSTGSVVSFKGMKSTFTCLISSCYLDDQNEQVSFFLIENDLQSAIEDAESLVKIVEFRQKMELFTKMSTYLKQLSINQEIAEKQKSTEFVDLLDSNAFSEMLTSTLLYLTIFSYSPNSTDNPIEINCNFYFNHANIVSSIPSSGKVFYLANSIPCKKEFNKALFDQFSAPLKPGVYFGKLCLVGNTFGAWQVSVNGSAGALIFTEDFTPIGINLEQNMFNSYQLSKYFNLNLFLPLFNHVFLSILPASLGVSANKDIKPAKIVN